MTMVRIRCCHNNDHCSVFTLLLVLGNLFLVTNNHFVTTAFVLQQSKTTTTISTTTSITTSSRKNTKLQVATTFTQPETSSSSLKKQKENILDILTSPSNDITDDSNDEESPKIGVLLLNLGGPETSDDVEGFLYNLFADPDIIRLPTLLSPLQSVIAYFISKRRAPKSREAYESIGGGSPILKYSNEQASLIEKSLKSRYNLDVQTYVAMRYWHPFTEDVLKQIQDDKINSLVVIPLYPQFSISTSGSSLRLLQETFAKNIDTWNSNKVVHTVIPSWYDRPGYVKSISNLINKELDSFTKDEIDEGLREGVDKGISKHVLFSAHGVPKSYIDAGDPYQEQIKACVDLISKELPGEEDGVKVHLSYQSRVGPIEWLRPYTDDVLVDLGTKEKVRNLVVVPISFVSEHIETLEEIDIEYKELALESGITNWRRCPALNTDQIFIDDMADMVVDALSEPMQTITEACISNNCFDDNDSINNNVEQEALIDSMAGRSNALLSSSSTSKQIQQQQAAGGNGINTFPFSNLSDKERERINGRVAIVGVILTLLIEFFNGQSLSNTLFH